VLFPLTGTELTYLEIIHPADFQHDELSRLPGPVAGMLLRHRLFAEELEKGVILRGRLRGQFVAQSGDTAAAAAAYARFLAASLPLTT
jgi:hypothetical protein